MTYTAKLDAIAEEAAENLKQFIKDGSSDIQDAILRCIKNAQLNESPAKFGLNLKIELGLDTGKVTNTLSWSTKHTLSAESDMPEQMKLKGMEEE